MECSLGGLHSFSFQLYGVALCIPMPLSYSSATLADLHMLIEQVKFNEEEYYAGAPTEEIREDCERMVNTFIQTVVMALKRGAEVEDIFQLAQKLTIAFEDEENEEAERADEYIAEVMNILEIEDWEDNV